MTDNTTEDLFSKIDALADPSKDDMTDAAVRMISELCIQLRAAQHERLLAEERLSRERARADGAEQALGSARAQFDQELSSARSEAATAHAQYLAECAARVEAQNSFMAELEMNRALVAGTEKERDILNRATDMLNQKLASLSMPPPAPARQQDKPKPSTIDFELKRDGANVLRGITAHMQYSH